MFAARILVLVPHPDDEVVGACAAIGRARAAGARVAALTLTTGVPARERFFAWQRGGHAARVERRRAEARAAAALLGIERLGDGDWPTRTLRLHLPEAEALVAAALAASAATMLWVPAFEGAHQDHDAANCLASRFADRVAVWEFAEYSNAGGTVRAQAFFDMRGGETVLELSEAERAFKRRALELYASERGNLAHLGVARESFRPLPKHDYAARPHPGTPFWARHRWARFHPRVDGTHPDELRRALAAYLAR